MNAAISPMLDALGVLWRQRRFALAMASRELKSRHRGAMLGVAWAVVRPFIQTAVLMFLVVFVFGASVSGGSSAVEYGVYLLSGLVFWQVLQVGLEAGSSLLREKMEIVKLTVYPVETLPMTNIVANIPGPAIGFAICLMLGIATAQVSPTVVLLPIPLAMLFVFVVGTSWFLMIAGVLIKDLREAVSIIVSLLMYVSPVVLMPEMMSERVWSLVMFNPFSHVILCFRDVFTGDWHPVSWLVFILMAASSVFIGGIVVERFKLRINEML